MKTKLNPTSPRGLQNCVFGPLVTASLLIAIALCCQTVRAADIVYTGGAGNIGTLWLTAANWSTAAVPGSLDNAIFNGTALTNICSVDMGLAGGTQQVGSITLTANQGQNFTIQNGSATSGTLVLNGVGGILLKNDYSTGGELILQSGNGSMHLGLANSGAIYSSSTLVSSSTPGRIEIYNIIDDYNGSHGITLTGPGNVYLRAPNTYSGNTVIQNGALELDALGSPGNGSGTIYLSGGHIQSGASRNGYNSGTFIANPIVLTTNAYIFNTASTANSTRYIPFSGSLGGSAGTLIIANPTSVTGNTFCPRFSGSFTFNLPVSVGDPPSDNNYNNAFNDTLGNFSAIDLCNASTNGPQTWNGIISGPGSLRRSSPVLSYSAQPGGVAILNGNNTYSGGSDINDGILFANNTAGSALGTGAVDVRNYGTLAGNGAVLTTVTVTNGGTIQPGATSTSVGNLAIQNLTMGPGANYNWQISSTTGTPGTAWDLVTCSSGWTDGGNNTNKNIIHISSVGAPTGWNNAVSHTWQIISNGSGSPGFNAANWAVDTTHFGGTAAGTFSLSTDGSGNLQLVYTPVPNSNPVAHMLLLAPGETPTYGTAPGKTGSASAQLSTVGYSVTVAALDASYHLCTNSFDTVTVASSAAGDSLPAIAPLVNGTITFPVVNNTVGSITMTATNYTEGPAVPTGNSIVPVNINSTTTTLASSINPAAPGVPISFSATVSSSAATVTGTVTFMKNGTTVLGTAPISGTSASLTLSGGTGTNTITAIYSGDGDNSGSTSSPLIQAINLTGGSLPPAGVAVDLQDGQDYAASASTLGATSNPVRGPWSIGGGSGSTSYIKILAGDLAGATSPDIRPLPNQTTTPPTNAPAKLQIAKAGTNSRWYYRSLSNNITSGAAYFSFLLNVQANPTTTDEFMGSVQAAAANQQGGTNNPPSASDPLSLHARVGSDSTHFNLGIERLSGEEAWTGDLADNTTYLVVLKYAFGSSSSNSIYINPIPGGTEPAPAAVAFSGGSTPEPANIGTVMFYECGTLPPGTSGLTSGTFQYDVMRADNNWATVTPSINGNSLGAMSLAFSPASQSIGVNQNSALITVTLQQSNLTFSATANTPVALSSTSGGGTFLSGADGTTVISSVTISNGNSTANFYYKDSIAGNPTITGASGLLTSATQSETVTNATAGTAPGFPPGGISHLANGSISLVSTGAVGVAWSLHATNNLAAPRPWPTIQSGTISTSPFTNIDLNAPNYANRFYYYSAP